MEESSGASNGRIEAFEDGLAKLPGPVPARVPELGRLPVPGRVLGPGRLPVLERLDSLIRDVDGEPTGDRDVIPWLWLLCPWKSSDCLVPAPKLEGVKTSTAAVWTQRPELDPCVFLLFRPFALSEMADRSKTENCLGMPQCRRASSKAAGRLSASMLCQVQRGRQRSALRFSRREVAN